MRAESEKEPDAPAITPLVQAESPPTWRAHGHRAGTFKAVEPVERRQEAELLAAGLQRRAEVMGSRLLRAATLLVRVAPPPVGEHLRDRLDEAAQRRPELADGLEPLREAVAAELVGAQGDASKESQPPG